MHKNITLSADESLIKKARLKAEKEQTSLSAGVRQCLEWYIGVNNAAENDTNLMQKALTTGDSARSYQIIQEFLNVAINKFTLPLKPSDSKEYLLKVLSPLFRLSCQVIGMNRHLKYLNLGNIAFMTH